MVLYPCGFPVGQTDRQYGRGGKDAAEEGGRTLISAYTGFRELDTPVMQCYNQ